MDILIKGMEMPKDCHDCKFLMGNYDDSECRVTCFFCFLKKETICECDDRELAKGIKPSTCPLVALPSHGRLCDLDYLIEHETYNIEQALFDSDEVLEDLKNAPVIVEATE